MTMVETPRLYSFQLIWNLSGHLGFVGVSAPAFALVESGSCARATAKSGCASSRSMNIDRRGARCALLEVRGEANRACDSILIEVALDHLRVLRLEQRN